MKPLGFVIMNVRIPCIRGYNEDQIAIVLDYPSMKECPVILGTPTLYRAIQVIKESEITQLAVPWAMSHLSYLIQGLQVQVGQEVRTDVGNKTSPPPPWMKWSGLALSFRSLLLVAKPFMGGLACC